MPLLEGCKLLVAASDDEPPLLVGEAVLGDEVERGVDVPHLFDHLLSQVSGPVLGGAGDRHELADDLAELTDLFDDLGDAGPDRAADGEVAATHHLTP